MCACLHRADLATHQLRDLLKFHTVVAAQYQHFTFLRRQLEHGPFEQHGLLLMFQMLAGRSVITLKVVCIVFVQARIGSMLPEVIEVGIARDLEHPGREGNAIAERMPIFQDPKKHLLSKIVSNRLAPSHSKEKIEQRAVMPVEKHTEFSDITAPYIEH